ncbi:hypothetical protein K501DRAFT_241532 [Backusella circina FSU 941]|nr:hypothetical protein K501DRAFT_241532 [Backusella circina FSU 941]
MRKHAVDDDYESSRNVKTEGNVDYLSYTFDEMDLAASWRVLTKRKLNIVNGIRLENASWRTWAKQRNNLKTISPETLNWLKDSDVTWLYGPLHTVIKNIDEEDRFAKPKAQTTEDTLGLMTHQTSSIEQKNISSSDIPRPPIKNTTEATTNNNNTSNLILQNKQQQPDKEPAVRPNASPLQTKKPLKSALKKVTMSDLLKRSASELEITNPLSISKVNQQLGAFSPSVIANHRQPKLRFNQYVEQCIALTGDEKVGGKKKSSATRVRMVDLAEDQDSTEEDNSDEYEPSSEYSDEDAIMMRPKPTKMRSSIRKIEPALLKTNSRSDQDDHSSDDSLDEDFPDPHFQSNKKNKRRFKKSYNTTSSSYNNWDAESAESDAFEKHIVQVSKGKQQAVSKDPAADKVPTNNISWDMDQNSTVLKHSNEKSDYEYVFDDDDWDTHSEHPDDGPFSLTQSNVFDNDDDFSLSESPPLRHVSKAPAVASQPVDATSSEAYSGNTNAKEQQQQQSQQQQSKKNVGTESSSSSTTSSSSSSLFSNIAHWAATHIWPSQSGNR